MKKKIILFLGNDYRLIPPQIEHFLPLYLSNLIPVYCFEYPRFKNMFELLLGKYPLLEKIKSGLTIYHSFGILPGGRTFKFINIINHRINFFLFKKLTGNIFSESQIITFTPEICLLNLKDKFSNIIYHVLDDYPSLPWWKNYLAFRQFKSLEKKLIDKVDKIIVVSETLYKKYKKSGRKIFLFKTPAEIAKPSKKPLSVPADLAGIPVPRVGFIGSIYEFKVNIPLVKLLLEKFPEVSFIWLGTLRFSSGINRDLILKSKNSHFLGFKENDQLQNYIANFNVCIIPYNVNRYGQSAYPVKVMNYLSFGKPVISTNLPSLKYLSGKKLIYQAENKSKFLLYLKQVLKNPGSDVLIEKRVTEAQKNSWQRRIGDYWKIILHPQHL